MISLLQFFSRTLLRFKRIGAVAPSSRILARAMCQQVDWDKAETILEIGPGTGVFTDEILRRKKDGSRLILIEKDEVFHKQLQARYSDALVLQGDVNNLDSILQAHDIHSVDAIISGLPVLLVPPESLSRFYQAAHDRLGPDADFIQFTYDARRFQKVTQPFLQSAEVREFVPWNLPPAFVMKLATHSQH